MQMGTAQVHWRHCYGHIPKSISGEKLKRISQEQAKKKDGESESRAEAMESGLPAMGCCAHVCGGVVIPTARTLGRSRAGCVFFDDQNCSKIPEHNHDQIH